MSAAPSATAGRRHICRPRPRAPGDLRPTDLIGAFFLLGIAFIAAGAVAAIVNWLDAWAWGRWLALHLCFVGGISSLIIGASQFFAGAFLSSDPPSRHLVRAQIVCWGGGSVALAIAVPLAQRVVVVGAVALLLAGLGLYGLALRRLASASLQTRPWATRWYLSAAAMFAVGIVAGTALALREPWPHGDLLSAHMVLNLIGWLGTAIVGTLHTFYPSLTRTTLPWPRLQGPAFLGWVGGVMALATGHAFAIAWLATIGWIALLCATVALLVNVAGCRRIAPAPLGLPVRLLGVAQLFLLAALALAAARALTGAALSVPLGTDRAALGTLLVGGWIGLTVAGSLLHLLAVVLRVRNFAAPMPGPRARADAATIASGALGVTALALGQLGGFEPLTVVGSIMLLTAYVLLGIRLAGLAARVVASARPSI